VFFAMALICKLKIGNLPFFLHSSNMPAVGLLIIVYKNVKGLCSRLESLGAWEASMAVQTSEFVVDGHQICQELFSLLKQLAVTNHLLIFHVSLHSFQEDLLHNLAKHKGETD